MYPQTHRLNASRAQPPKSGKLGDWRRIAEPQAALLFELARYDRRERVPEHRRPIRAIAKAIIEGRRAWPRELLPWKLWRELTYTHGQGRLPPWEDEANLTRPQRDSLRALEREWERDDARWVAESQRRDRIAELLA